MGLPDRESIVDSTEPLPSLLRPNDVARLLAVSRAWVYAAARSGRIPSLRLGSQDGPLRFLAADIDKWLADSRANWRPGRSWRPTPAQAERPTPVVPIRGQQSFL
jgi:excisionase family DNA binding protein